MKWKKETKQTKSQVENEVKEKDESACSSKERSESQGEKAAMACAGSASEPRRSGGGDA